MIEEDSIRLNLTNPHFCFQEDPSMMEKHLVDKS